MNIKYFLAVDKVADPQATIAVSWAGVFPYYSNRRCFDVLGKCDPYIARTPAVPGQNRAGHNKLDIEYTILHHKPDIILHACKPRMPAYRRNYQAIAVEVDGTDVSLYVRRESKLVNGGKKIDYKTGMMLFYQRWSDGNISK